MPVQASTYCCGLLAVAFTTVHVLALVEFLSHQHKMRNVSGNALKKGKMEINSTEMIKENGGDIKSGSLDRRTHV